MLDLRVVRIVTFFFLSFCPRRLRRPTDVRGLLLAGRRRRRRRQRSAADPATAVIRSSLDEHFGRRRRRTGANRIETLVVVIVVHGRCGSDQSQDDAAIGERPACGRVHVGGFCAWRRGRQDVHHFRVRSRKNFQ